MASRVDKRKKEIEEAIKEAKRFLEKAQDASVEMNIGDWFYGGSCNASMKRSSLDLSKALVKLRKPI